MKSWDHHLFHTYVRVAEGGTVRDLERSVRAALEGAAPPEVLAAFAVEPIAVAELHLVSDFELEMRPQGVAATIFLFSTVAMVVLVIACINFTNLATARSIRRAKEIGLKRALGVSRAWLAVELLGESVTFAVVAALGALALVPALLPTVSELAGVPLAMGALTEPGGLLALAALALVVGVLAGTYPALSLSALRPAETLRGRLTRGETGLRLRNGLVVLQFAISTFLVVVTLIAQAQMRYANALDVGFETENIVLLNNVDDAEIDFGVLEQSLMRNPYIRAVTASSRLPGTRWPSSRRFHPAGRTAESRDLPVLGVEYGFCQAYDIELLAGRHFDSSRGTDRRQPPSDDQPLGRASYVATRRAAELFGWSPEEAVGQVIESANGRAIRGTVVGVVEDLYLGSVYEPLRPLLMRVDEDNYNVVSIRVAGDSLPATLRFIDRTWDAMSPQMPILRSFLDDEIAALFEREQRQIAVFERFAALAVLVACLGLFGLASFATERRTKEIGVRKVLGASVTDILVLLNRSFVGQVLIGTVIALPAVSWYSDRWLDSFAIHLDPGLAPFAVGTLLAITVALATVTGQAMRAAMARPVKSLRYE